MIRFEVLRELQKGKQIFLIRAQAIAAKENQGRFL